MFESGFRRRISARIWAFVLLRPFILCRGIPLRSLRGLAQSMVPTGSIKSRSKLNRAKNGFCARFTRTSCSCLRSGISPLFPHERWRQMQPGFPKLMTAIHDAQSALVSSHKKGRPIRSRTAFILVAYLKSASVSNLLPCISFTLCVSARIMLIVISFLN